MLPECQVDITAGYRILFAQKTAYGASSLSLMAVRGS
jgi:hypothetical protein